jgi:hypothetical protein
MSFIIEEFPYGDDRSTHNVEGFRRDIHDR